MPEPDFAALNRKLRRAGVAPRHAQRTVEELSDHFAALRDELQAQGCEAGQAGQLAALRLGDLDAVGRAIAADPAAKCWYYRWPVMGRIALPVACVAALPVTPLLAGVQHVNTLMRWSLCLFLGGLFTALLFGLLQLTIRFS